MVLPMFQKPLAQIAFAVRVRRPRAQYWTPPSGGRPGSLHRKLIRFGQNSRVFDLLGIWVGVPSQRMRFHEHPALVSPQFWQVRQLPVRTMFGLPQAWQMSPEKAATCFGDAIARAFMPLGVISQPG